MTLVVEWLGPVLGVVFTVVLVGVHGVVCEAMVARVRRQPVGVHWSERNRTITEAKSAMLMSAIAVMVAGQVTRLVLLGPFSAPDPWLVGLPVAVAQLAALWSLSARATRAIDPPEMPTVVATQTRLVFAMVVLTTLIGLALIWYLGAGDHPAALAGWFVGSTGLVLAYWNLDRVLAVLGLLSAAPPSVRQAAAGADLDPDAVHELHFDRPNALAFPSGAVGVTSGMIAALDADEVASILRHERVHTIESRTTKLSRVLPLVLVCLVGPLVVGSFDRNLSTNLPVGLVVLLATLVVLGSALGRRSRDLEHDADHQAIEHDPALFAQALEKVYRCGGLPVTHQRGSHPTLYDRLLAAEAPPEYPRPDNPSRRATLAAGGVVLAMVFVLLVTTAVAGLLLPHRLGAELRLATGSERDIGVAAAEALIGGDQAATTELLTAGADISERDPWIDMIEHLAVRGHCAKADDQLAGLDRDDTEAYYRRLGVLGAWCW